jgi:hypothetical protein
MPIDLLREINVRLPLLMCWFFFFWSTLLGFAYHARWGMKCWRCGLMVWKTLRSD